jgi:hypothetical protein
MIGGVALLAHAFLLPRKPASHQDNNQAVLSLFSYARENISPKLILRFGQSSMRSSIAGSPVHVNDLIRGKQQKMATITHLNGLANGTARHI